MPWAGFASQKQLILTIGPRASMRASTTRIWRRNYGAKRTSPSAARPCAAHLRTAKLASARARRASMAHPPPPRAAPVPCGFRHRCALTDAAATLGSKARGPVLTLIGFQDDATAQILAAHFQLEAEKYPRLSSFACTP